MNLPPLTDTQRVVLATAASRDDGAVLPLPPTLKLAGAARDRLLAALVGRALLEEVACGPEGGVWRRSEEGTLLALRISPAGLMEMGIEHPVAEEASQAMAPESGVPGARTANRNSSPEESSLDDGTSATPKPASKLDMILSALQRPEGATLQDLMQATGWQAHSVRGFLSGTVTKKLGLDMLSEKVDGVRRYRVASTAGTASGTRCHAEA